MRLKSAILATLLCLTSTSSFAALINEMQGCQGYMDFIETKLVAGSKKYPAAEVQKVRKGLSGYDRFIQTSIVSPGLLKFSNGDKAKADQLQTQVDAYRKNIVTRLQKRYPQNRLFADHALSLNNCAK
ncbi:MAG: hypothetical protein ACPG47_12250, partial [Leucothrix sp.]